MFDDLLAPYQIMWDHRRSVSEVPQHLQQRPLQASAPPRLERLNLAQPRRKEDVRIETPAQSSYFCITTSHRILTARCLKAFLGVWHHPGFIFQTLETFFLTSIPLNSLQGPPLMSSGALLSSFLLFQRNSSCSHLSDLSVKINQAWKMGTSSVGVVFLPAQWGNSLFSTRNHTWALTVEENESPCLFSPAPLITGFFSQRGDGGPSSLVLQSAWRCWERLVPAGASAGVWTHQAHRQYVPLGCVCGECVCVCLFLQKKSLKNKFCFFLFTSVA